MVVEEGGAEEEVVQDVKMYFHFLNCTSPALAHTYTLYQ